MFVCLWAIGGFWEAGRDMENGTEGRRGANEDGFCFFFVFFWGGEGDGEVISVT